VIAADAVLARVKALPTLPVAVLRLQEAARDERNGAADLERVIRPDPALTTNLLRVANSAAFGGARRIASVRDAVARLGTRRLVELATSAGFARVLPPVLPGYGIDAAAFRLHAIAVAVLAERLGGDLGVGVPDVTFTAGLLHDVGKLAIGAFLADEGPAFLARLRTGRMTSIDAEREVLGTDHARVGDAVAEAWRLPGAIRAVARWHHAPLDAPGEVDERAVALVHVADGLAHAMGYGEDAAELARAIDPEVLRRLGVRVRVLERAAGETAATIREMSETLDPAKGGAP
jgi:putative nucleotidyltransferase with HDIG domain